MTMPSRLNTTVHEKVWGTPHTEPWYRNPDHRDVGEIWFCASDSTRLLVKLLFTSANLSVQVHPNDEYAHKHHRSRGKTEMWHILRADPGAQIALGVKEKLTPARLRESAETGEIMKLLDWIPVSPGDTFFIPAGTIHAIGGGIVLCEVQQHSDITYRLYDYGRPRELHLDHAVTVSYLEPREGMVKPELLVECPYFRTERLEVRGSHLAASPSSNTIYVALQGEGLIGDQPFVAGEAWEVTAGSPPFGISSAHAVFLVTAAPRPK
jgi:mannose-6-phosphate isomerase